MTASPTGPAPTPRALAAETHRRLAAAGDPEVARGAAAYFKGEQHLAFYGIKAPSARAIERELLASVKGRWGVEEALAYCDLMLSAPQLDAKSLGLLLLARHRRSCGKGVLRRCTGWLADGRCANWASTDGLSTLVMTPILRRFPDEIPGLQAWTRSRNMWVRRAAAVSLTPLARRGEALAAAYRIATALLGDREDLMHKATGWLLREAGKTDPARLERYLRQHGPRIPRTALRYAIEKFPPAKRKALLAATRGRGKSA